MTDAIDTSPNPTQLPSCEPVFDSPTSHAKVQELLATDHAVLSLSQVPNTTVQRTKRTFPMSDLGNVPLVAHATDGGHIERTHGAHGGTKDVRKGGSSPPVPPLALIP